MKGFWKTVLAVIVALLIVSVISTVLGLGLIGSLSAIGNSKATLPTSGILRIDMSKLNIVEQTTEANPFENIQSIGQETPAQLGIWDAIQALEKASNDPAVKFVYILADGTTGGLAELEELRGAIRKVSENGKTVVAYTESPSNGAYYIASAADKIYITPFEGGINSLTGLSSQIIYFKDLLDKVGVNVQLIRHGKYKSAGEAYIRNDISAENRTQYEVFLGSIWRNMSEQMAQSRAMNAEEFNALIDNLSLNSPEDFLNAGLVDALYSREDLIQQLCNLAVVDKPSELKFMDLADYAENKVVPNYRAKEKIAIIYADGEIKDGDDTKDVTGDRFASIIAKVRKDSTVKAVVFRVSSPGGSVLASEKIKDEVERLRSVKPVIASYGNYAASGGYWISNSCDKIYTNASTLTGSIGVFSMIPDLSKTAKNLAHVNVVTISTNKHGDMLSLMSPLDKDEMEYMQASVESIYDKFTSYVAEGRDLEKSYVDEIAQGRVWAGTDAISIGLCDEIGTIEDAIKYAASVADTENGSDLSNWQIVAYPKPLTLLEQITESLSGTPEETIFSGTPFEGIVNAYKDFSATKSGQVYARLPYAITIK